MLILTDNADALLDTIRSRCIRMDMEAISREVIEQELISEGTSKGEAKECAGFARGNLGIAKELVSGGLLRELKDETVKTLKNMKNLDAFEIFNLSTEMDKERGGKVLDIIFKWYRDMLMCKARLPGKDDVVLVGTKRILEGLGRITERVEDAALRLQSGVKAEAVFETLYLKIREEYK